MECPICKKPMESASKKFFCMPCKVHIYFVKDALLIRKFKVVISPDMKSVVNKGYADELQTTIENRK